MQPGLQVWLFDWTALAAPGVVLISTLAIGYAVRHLLSRAVFRWSQRTASSVPLIVLRALKRTFMLWVLILGVYLAMQVAETPAAVSTRVSLWLAVLAILSVTLMGIRIAGDLIRAYGTAVPGALPVTTLTQTLAQIAIAILGLLLVLNQLDFSITPMLTALGVGGLAVALALQDTLSNLFAGFYIAVAGQIRVGDYIRLNSGEEGYVTDITWRSTSVRMLANNLIMIPNAKLAQAIVTNFHLPEKRMSLVLPIGVSYQEDPDHIERILLEEANAAIGELPGLLAEPPPAVRFNPGFGDFSLNFSLVCQVAEFVDQFGVQHELRKRLLRRFRREGVEIPFPTRTVYMEEKPAGRERIPFGTPHDGRSERLESGGPA